MDLTKIIREAIDQLPKGEYSPGLASVANHINVAVRHLESAQKTKDQHLFTDTVYRCNQAFEGSIKELYRVLAAADPSKKTPYEIESFLESGDILRPNVLNQFKRYRQEWRNPSTHDYTLDFDENEAFIAIVNIAAFAKVSIGQISSKIAFENAKLSPASAKKTLKPTMGLAESMSVFCEEFLEEQMVARIPERALIFEWQIASALGGFIASVPGVDVSLERQVGKRAGLRADIFVQMKDQKCVIEVKSAMNPKSFDLSRDISQVVRLLDLAGLESGVLCYYSQGKDEYTTKTIYHVADGPKEIYLVAPKKLALSVDN
jgi:hypothetical protein